MEDGDAPEKPLTVAQAASALKVSPRRVNALITSGRLKAEKFGAAWMIQPSDLIEVLDRKPGRPREEDSASQND
ncbi:MAG: DNA-binding protein [Alphaproteobacteria bacterium]|nr:MAG: DNA-binding protein [Alphaproteobacteria bacterium]